MNQQESPSPKEPVFTGNRAERRRQARAAARDARKTAREPRNQREEYVALERAGFVRARPHVYLPGES